MNSANKPEKVPGGSRAASIDLSAGVVPKNTPGASPTESSALTQKSPPDQQPALRAEVQAAIEQLKVWAQTRKVVRFDSGTLLNSVNFMARLMPSTDGSFVVHGAPEYCAGGLGGCISPSYAEYVRVLREDDCLAVILRRLDGSSCIVFDDGGSVDKLLRSQAATPLKN